MVAVTYSLEVPDGFPGLRPFLWVGADPGVRVVRVFTGLPIKVFLHVLIFGKD